MPLRFEEARTPGGAPLLIIRSSGHVALADAEAFGRRVEPGGPNHMWRVLLLTEKGIEYEPAARKYFPTTQGNYRAIAAVVTNSIVRAAINVMIRLAGGTNPMADFDGFKDMTDEAVVNAAPDIILMTEHSFERSGGIDGVLNFPGVALTPAGKARRIVTVSDVYFQGFGPGLGKAVLDLAAKFSPGSAVR